jgi:hypothetical protein
MNLFKYAARFGQAPLCQSRLMKLAACKTLANALSAVSPISRYAGDTGRRPSTMAEVCARVHTMRAALSLHSDRTWAAHLGEDVARTRPRLLGGAHTP